MKTVLKLVIAFDVLLLGWFLLIVVGPAFGATLEWDIPTVLGLITVLLLGIASGMVQARRKAILSAAIRLVLSLPMAFYIPFLYFGGLHPVLVLFLLWLPLSSILFLIFAICRPRSA